MSRLSVILAAGVICAGPGVAQAADDVFGAPVSSWGGFYAGVIGGAATGTADQISSPTTNDISLKGALFGGRIGYDQQFSNHFVVGAAADIVWSSNTGSVSGVMPSKHTITWESSLRARLGYDGGGMMPYVTAGLAFAGAKRETTSGGGGTASQNHPGWTIGIGVEAMLAPNVSADLLYRYSDYSSEIYTWSPACCANPKVDLKTHAVTAAINYRF